MGNCLCVYIVLCDYLCLFLMFKIVSICFYCMLKVCKKTNIPLNIYTHNNLRYIVQSYTLLYTLIMQLRF